MRFGHNLSRRLFGPEREHAVPNDKVMKRYLLPALVVVGVAITASAAWLSYQLNHRPSLLPYAERWLRPADAITVGLRVTFLGVSTLLFDDGESAILTDGFFTRPNRRIVFLGKVAPDPDTGTESM